MLRHARYFCFGSLAIAMQRLRVILTRRFHITVCSIRYSESLGFDSFTLPLNERDEASPPPTPPVRDASSLKGVCYGPGHEKYPSWPSAPERHPDEDIHSSGHSGSHRSKSWTDHTNYPKEKPAQYTRPHTKRPNPAFTQQVTYKTLFVFRKTIVTLHRLHSSNVNRAFTHGLMWWFTINWIHKRYHAHIQYMQFYIRTHIQFLLSFCIF